MKSLLLIFLCAGLTADLRAQMVFDRVRSIAAVVNGSVITDYDVDQLTGPAVELIATLGLKPAEFRERQRKIFFDGLNQLIENQLILDEWKVLEASGRKFRESYIDDKVKERIHQRYGDRVTATRSLHAQGSTLEAFRRETRDHVVIENMRYMNVARVLVISPQKIELAYATNLNTFKVGEEIKLRTIVVPTTAIAREILTKIDQGATFAEMASVYSSGTQRRDGGDWGWIERKKLNGGIADVAGALNVGQRSGITGLARIGSQGYWFYQYGKNNEIAIARRYTDKDVFVEEKKYLDQAPDPTLPAPQEYYLMMVEEKRPARVRSLQEMRDEIERNLLGEEGARLYRKWIARLRAKSFVRIF